MIKKISVIIMILCAIVGIAAAQPLKPQMHRPPDIHRPNINHAVHRPPIRHIHYYRPVRYIGPMYPPHVRYCDPNYFYYYSGGINIRYGSYYSSYPCRYPMAGFSITL